MSQTWLPIDWDDCPVCGDLPEVLTRGPVTTEGRPEYVYDSEPVRCRHCKWPGRVVISGYPEAPYVEWSDEPDETETGNEET